MTEPKRQQARRELGAEHTGWGARSWLAAAVSRNPLIGRHHRREAWIVIASLMLLAVATTISAGAGAVVYSTRIDHHQAEKASWMLVSATATEAAVMPVDSLKPVHQVHACWPALGQQRCDTIDVDYPVAQGQQVPIWIDRQGQYLPTSDPAQQALTDAAITGVLIWCVLAAAISAVALTWRRTLIRSRDAAMDAEIATLLRGRDDHPSQ